MLIVRRLERVVAQVDLSFRWAHKLFCRFRPDPANLKPTLVRFALNIKCFQRENPISEQLRFRNLWAASWQNQQSECAPSEDSDQTGRMISLGIRPVWSESSLSAWRKLGSLATHWAHSEDSDQTGRMPWLIWVFAGRTATLLVLSRGGLYMDISESVLNE